MTDGGRAPRRVADLRSDTVTQPTEAMRAAMASAEVGDDVLGEDPTVARLEAEAAAVFGTGAALFVPSGTMANQIAVHVHCRPGDELICERRCHVYRYEAGGVARWSGTQVRALDHERGFPTPAQIEDAVLSDDVHDARSRLLVLENTHNMAGGTVLDPDGVRDRVAAAARHGLAVHVDGARLFNAAVGLGCPPAALLDGVDSASVCLSKGLGAPIGSVLLGDEDFVAAARRVRKALGGGMRQVGVLAAAGLLALRDGPGQLARDHHRARRLAEGLGGLSGLRVTPPDSNIVLLELEVAAPADLLSTLARRGVLASAVDRRRVRMVTHRDLTDADVERCLQAVGDWHSGGGADRGA